LVFITKKVWMRQSEPSVRDDEMADARIFRLSCPRPAPASVDKGMPEPLSGKITLRIEDAAKGPV
jgi:hypothetical protein